MIEPPSVKEELGSVMCPIFGAVVSGEVGEPYGYLWMLDSNNDLMPSNIPAANAVLGQAWEYDANGDLQPTDAPITDDPFWEYDGNGDLQPIT